MHNKQLPKFCTSGRNLVPEGVVIHYFSCKNVDPERQFDLAACRNLMIDLNRPKDEREHYLLADRDPKKRLYASAHLFIGREGEMWKLVDFDKQAYHAGRSLLDNRPNCNAWTLGVELIGTNTSGFTDAQYEALVALLNDWRKQFNIGDTIAGHDQVRHAAIEAGQKAGKKYDPSGRSGGTGDNFDWGRVMAGLTAETA